MNRKLISLSLAICWLPVSFAATVHLRGRVNNEACEPATNDLAPWLHSDMKDMANFYVYKLYEELIQKGNMK